MVYLIFWFVLYILNFSTSQIDKICGSFLNGLFENLLSVRTTFSNGGTSPLSPSIYESNPYKPEAVKSTLEPDSR